MKQKLFCIMLILFLAFLQVDCATKKGVKKEVQRIDQEMETIESAVEANEVRIKEHDSRLAQHETKLGELSKESQEALQRAQNAEKLAMGKLLYEVTLSDDAVKFALGQSELTDTAKEILDNLVAQLKAENRNVYIEIQGFTDSSGSEEYNIKLGQERAETVRRYLSGAGIPLHRMSTISYGETRPITDNKTAEGRKKNRRVVLLILE